MVYWMGTCMYRGEWLFMPGSCKQSLCDGRTADDDDVGYPHNTKIDQLQQEIYVNEGLTRNLLWTSRYHRVADHSSSRRCIRRPEHDGMESYPKLFTGLGNFGNPHEINLKKDAFVPFALNTPRRIPLALRDQVKAVSYRGWR